MNKGARLPVFDPQKAEERNYDKKLLTLLSSICTMESMARFKDIVSGLRQQTDRKCAELEKDAEELARHRESYQRYREISAQMETKERSVKVGFALLYQTPEGDAYVTKHLERLQETTGIALEADDLDPNEVSLWRVIREVLRQNPEIRLFELENHLKNFGVKTTRPAIDSALATHPKEFKTVKRGREKYVSLKGA